MFDAFLGRPSKWTLVAVISCLIAASSGQATLGAEQPAVSTPPAQAQDLVGTWQGPKAVLKITETRGGKLHGELYYLGPEVSGLTRNGNPISSITIQGRHVRLDLDEWFGTLDGSLSADGKTLAGTFTAQPGQFPFEMDLTSDKAATPIDPSPHKVLFVPVDKDVRLEVLDWGGEGPPLVLLAGNGNTAHVYDDFAPKFIGKHHVYAITRRGWGLSSKPEPKDGAYDADRLGDDVLAVIDALKLDRPVIAGHSLAGEELSSIGTRHPEKVSGLIYLDASWGYAFYDPDLEGGLYVYMSVLRRDFLALAGAPPSQARALNQDIQATLPLLQKDLQAMSADLKNQKDPPLPARRTLRDRMSQYVFTGQQRYTNVKGPVLAIVALPHACGTFCDAPPVKLQTARETAQTDAFQAGVPQARIVRIPDADHYVFRSNEADVIREMNAFMDGLR